MQHEVTTHNTRQMIAAALKTALLTKPFSKITVSEIVQTCSINRKTFYYHFEDIYALLKWLLNEEAIQVVHHFNLLIDYEEAIRFITNYITQNRYLFNCVYDPTSRDELKQFFFNDFISLITSVIEEAERQTGASIDATFKNYAAKFYTEALASMLVDWIKTGKQSDQEQIIGYLSSIISFNIENMFLHMRKTAEDSE